MRNAHGAPVSLCEGGQGQFALPRFLSGQVRLCLFGRRRRR